MAKLISQETFNAVVEENINDFEMTEEEAVQDAIKQFKAQGVNLSSIVTDSSKAHSIIDSVKRLKNSPTTNEVLEILDHLTALLKDEMSVKLLAAKEGLYPVIISYLNSEATSDKISALHTLTVLMDGYPDLMDEKGISLILQLVSPDNQSEEILAALGWLVVCVTRHEGNRAKLIRGGIASNLRKVASAPDMDQKVIKAVCDVVRVLVMDDDVRVVHGDAHEHARTLAPELIPLFIRLLEELMEDASVTSDLLQALSTLIVRNEFCILFHEKGGLKPVLDAMLEHSESECVTRQSMHLLKGLAGSDEVKGPIVASGGAALVVAALDKHYKSSQAAVAGCMCIAALSLRSPVNTMALASAGVVETLVRCMNHWKKNRSIVKNGCMAIRNQISRCPELKPEYLDQQLEPLLREVRVLHGDLEFDAKKVLVDLGCDVQLKEEWRGRGVQMSN